MGIERSIPGHVAAREAASRGGVWQAQAMARTLGIDLTRVRHSGLIGESCAQRIATACTGCPALAECMAYVAAPPQDVRAAPQFCALGDIFDCMVRLSGGPK